MLSSLMMSEVYAEITMPVLFFHFNHPADIVFHIPPGIISPVCPSFSASKIIVPVPCGSCLPFVSYPDCATCISRLLNGCRPSAIFRAVVAVVVDSINRELRPWCWPHIRIEICKRVAPPLADSNAAPTVVFVEF